LTIADYLFCRPIIYIKVLELEIKHKHGGFNINYEKATVLWHPLRSGYATADAGAPEDMLEVDGVREGTNDRQQY
jgi:hypothetical protein